MFGALLLVWLNVKVGDSAKLHVKRLLVKTEDEMDKKKCEKETENRQTNIRRQKMGLIDLDARAAVSAGPDGRDGRVEDKLHSGCDRMRMRGRQAASVCVWECVGVCA